MKLEPVYLVAPPPPRPTVSTRRAFLLAGSCLLVGAAAGFAGGRLTVAAGPRPSDPNQPDPTLPPEPPPIADDRLLWLWQQCDEATPTATLLRNRGAVLQHLPRRPDDARLWRGVERMVYAVLSDPQLPDRRRIAIELLDVLEHGPTPVGFDSALTRNRLRDVARGR